MEQSNVFVLQCEHHLLRENPASRKTKSWSLSIERTDFRKLLGKIEMPDFRPEGRPFRGSALRVVQF
jgi:hypothetical protein